MTEEYEDNEISLDMLANIKPQSNKPELLTRTKATIVGTPTVHRPTTDDVGVTKAGVEYNKFYFKIQFKLDEPFEGKTDISQAFTFKVYPGESLSWGSEKSNTGELIQLMCESFRDFDKSKGIVDTMKFLENRKVSLITKETSYQSQTFKRYKIAEFRE